MLTTVEELEALYGQPKARSVAKEIPFISDAYGAFILASPFVILASAGAGRTGLLAQGGRGGLHSDRRCPHARDSGSSGQ